MIMDMSDTRTRVENLPSPHKPFIIPADPIEGVQAAGKVGSRWKMFLGPLPPLPRTCNSQRTKVMQAPAPDPKVAL